MSDSREHARLEVRIDRLYDLVTGFQERLDAHIGNHHSRTSTIKQGSAIGASLSLLYVVVELLRRFAF